MRVARASWAKVVAEQLVVGPSPRCSSLSHLGVGNWELTILRSERMSNEPEQIDRVTLRSVTRRHFFEQTAFGIGGLALASLMDGVALAEAQAQSTRTLQFTPKAKRVIYLFMAGAPSQIDLFDPKPALTKHDGQDIPEEFIKGERFAFIKGTPKLLASPFQFKKHGRSGAEISELLPNLAKVADDIAIVRSMRTTQFNHAPAQIFKIGRAH